MVLLVLPAPKVGQDTTIAVLVAEAGRAGLKVTVRGVLPTKTPADAE